MRLTFDSRTGQRALRRRGVVLIHVIGMLALLALVGLSYETFSEATRVPAVRSQLGDEAHELALEAVILARDLRPGFVEAIQRPHRQSDFDWPAALDQLDEFADRAAALHDRVRTAYGREDDSRARESLHTICIQLDELQTWIDHLRWIVEEIIRGA